ncbi:phytoene/squalene synthase family protein [Patescibacteria group bacterium]|nr:phytoene/squalene synthase family protein [Patescibacteria group bacterium]MBP9710446.1 phytoene/squalene synthase family protein [Patescibacteria group bacterium]
MNYSEAVEVCRRIHHEYGTSYYWATRLFPREIREATHVLYAFFRVPDEMVDTVTGAKHLRDQYQVAQMTEGLSSLESLRVWQAAWQESGKGTVHDPVLSAARELFQRYHIPEHYATDFLQAMQQDLTCSRYGTYEDLTRYMYGSAAVVGLMMTYVIGFTSPEALPYAEKLGYAMQLTNFLRDIREDFEERGRIYLPQDELKQFGLSDDDIENHIADERFMAWMQFQIARADALYEEANQGIALLHPRGRRGVRAGSDLYRLILRKIEQQGYDIYRQRARTSMFEKIKAIFL